MTQLQVTKHFKTLASGALIFTQSTLSRKLEQRSEIEAQIAGAPGVASAKKIRVVTCPEVFNLLNQP